MSAPDRKAYTFATADQWGACLTSGLRPDGSALALCRNEGGFVRQQLT